MSKRTLIIGGGVIGLCTAYYCARRGHEVTVIERGPADHEGCSFGNAGLIVPSHVIPLAAPGMVLQGLKWMRDPGSPFYIKPRLNKDLLHWGWRFFRAANRDHVARAAPLIRDLNLASRDCYQELAISTGNDFGLTERGVINLCRTPRGLEHESRIAQLAERIGLQVDVLDAGQTAAILPDLEMNIVGSVYYPQDCHLSPSRLMASLKRLLDKLPVKFDWNTEPTGWYTERGHIASVRTTKGDFSADEYVICAGAWSPVVVRDLGLRLPVQAGKGYSLTITNPPRLPSTAAILSEARVAMTPMGESLRFAGTMEIAGLDESITLQRVERIIAAACQYFPEFKSEHFHDIKPWRGLRPCTPDGLPYIGRVKRFSNLSVAAGHAMMGLSLGPITGKSISELLSDETPSIAIDMLAPDRYE